MLQMNLLSLSISEQDGRFLLLEMPGGSPGPCFAS